MKRAISLLVLLLLLVGVLSAVLFYRFAQQPLVLPATPFEFSVKSGATVKVLSRQLTGAGLLPEPYLFVLLGRITGKTAIQAGTYRIDTPTSPLELLQKLVDGDVVPISITFVEGTTFAEMRSQLEHAEQLKVTLKGLGDAEIMKRIGASESFPEGLFFPDTYQFAAGSTDLELLKTSYQAMQRKLADAWAMRDPDLPYRRAYDALIMASIIEKETGRALERPLIASVFINRLQRPMRLQTDPTVIYGMGSSFDGNIRKRDLTADTPYNTYTRDGLPPTPIAMPGWASISAAVKPAKSDKLYFVGKGDGSHYFSASLPEHNRAVSKYQLGR